MVLFYKTARAMRISIHTVAVQFLCEYFDVIISSCMSTLLYLLILALCQVCNYTNEIAAKMAKLQYLNLDSLSSLLVKHYVMKLFVNRQRKNKSDKYR